MLKSKKALSILVHQYVNGISQGEKTPQYYRTAKNQLLTKTITQGLQVAQPIGNQTVSTVQSVRYHPTHQPQLIPFPVSQSVGSNVSYTQPSHITQVTQIPLSVLQSYVKPTPQQSQSITAPQDHSIHNIPDNTTLPMLNP